MSNTVRDYSKEKLELKRLLKLHGQAKVSKRLSISPKDMNMILSSKKKYISQKIADRIMGYEKTIKGKVSNIEILEEATKIPKNFEPGGAYHVKDINNVKFITNRLSNTKEHIDNIRKDTINRLLKEKDILWNTIFFLCTLLILCSGLIVRLSYLVASS